MEASDSASLHDAPYGTSANAQDFYTDRDRADNRNRAFNMVRPEIQGAAWVLDLPKITASSIPGRYLTGRGLDFGGRYPEDLREDRHGNLVALLRDNAGVVCSYQRLLLVQDKGSVFPRKAGVKMMSNPPGYQLPGDAAVRLGRVGEKMGVAEGIETALSALKLHGRPVWALCGSSRMERWTPPHGVRVLHIFKDRTKERELEKARATGATPPVEKAARVLGERMHEKGIAVFVHEPEVGIRLWDGRAVSDFNDTLRNELLMDRNSISFGRGR